MKSRDRPTRMNLCTHSSRSFLTLSLPRHEARERWMELILEGLAGAFAILWKEFPPKMAIQVWSFAEISYNQRIKELVVWYLSNSTVVQDRILSPKGSSWWKSVPNGLEFRGDTDLFSPTSLEKTRLNSKLRIKSRTKTLDMVLFQRDYCSQWSLWNIVNQHESTNFQFHPIYINIQ